jgi:hypothetical protein
VGDAVPSISAKDQHGIDCVFTNGTGFLLIATEKENAKSANLIIAGQGMGGLEKHGAVYMMDIHTMPAIARLFALPKLRKYPHRIVLIDSPNTLSWVMVRPGMITVLALKPDSRIMKISFWDPGKEPLSVAFQ